MSVAVGRDDPPLGEDVLVLTRWTHGDVPVVRIRTLTGGDLGAIAGEAAIIAVVVDWLHLGVLP